MFIALNGSLLAGGKIAWTDMVRLAARLGYPGVEVSLNRAVAEGADAVNALFEHLRLRPASLDLPVNYSKDDAAFQASLERLPAAAQFAAAIHCPRMCTYVLSSSETPKAELRARYLERFRKAAEIVGRSGVRIGIEFLGPLHLRRMFPHEFIWRMEEMVEFAQECGPNVGLLLDSWHWHHAGASTADIVSAGRSRIVHVHVNDARKQPAAEVRDDDRLMPGEGSIDLVGFFQALQKVGYADAVSVEVLGRGLKQMAPEEGARLELETGRKVMEKAGVPWK
jgi:sugar phosphate isomerase/epimerase